MSKILLKRSRQFSSLSLVAAAALLLFFAFVNRTRSAAPAAATLQPTDTSVTWTGTSLGGASADESTCDPTETINCDTYTLTLNGNPAAWAGKKVRISIGWPSATDDYDVFVHKGSNSGQLVGSSAQGGAGPEVVDLDPALVGTGTFTVHVVYFMVIPPAQEYTGTALVVGGAIPTPTPVGSPTPPPTGPGVARFFNYYPAAGVADDAGEPSVGVNWNTEENHHNFAINGGAPNSDIPNGGTENYYGGFLTFMLRARFDDCSSPAGVEFEQKPVTLPALPRAAGDPILFTDHETGRTFVSQLLGLTPAGSTMEFTDDDGESFTPSEGGAPSGVDHQTVGGGPFHSPLPSSLPNPAPYPNGVYYASQSIAEASAQLSVDGGITFPIQNAMFTAAQCAGLHGHLKVAPDGTAFVPNKACTAPGGIALLDGGEASVVVTEDNGLNWTVRPIPGATTSGNDDPSVGVSICRPDDPSCDKATRSNTIYLGYQAADGHPGIAVSHDKGQTWEHITNVGAIAGGPVIKNCAFPEVVAGDPDRAAFAFFGTETGGTNADQPDFPGVWYLYIATTYDGGITWTVTNATPGDPIQRGGICGDGTCRNLLDFFDIQVDKEGRIVVGGEDGCIGGCVNGGPNSFTAKAFITRQSGGNRLFANFDPMEPTAPGAPAVDGILITDAGGSRVELSWPVPDNGGSAITGYHVYRRIGGEPNAFVLVATVTEPRYVDSPVNPNVENAYRVTALNVINSLVTESPFCSTFVPTAGTLRPQACDLPGVLVSNDVTQTGTDDDSGQNMPLDPRVNARQLFIAEPFVTATTDNLVFTLQVSPSTMNSAPPSSQWFIIWNRQGNDPSDSQDASFDRLYVAMATDPTGAFHFDFGKFGVPLALPPATPDPLSNTPVKYGNCDSGSFDPLTGVITITISKSKLRDIDGGPTKYQPTSSLSATNVRTYLARPDYQPDANPPVTAQRSQNNASDITADGSYNIIGGNTVCAPPAQLVSAVSRKTHGAAGDFDVKLFPIVPSTLTPIECRTGGAADGAGKYTVVMTFASPVTFTKAAVSQGQVTALTNANIVTLKLRNLKNQRTATITLQGVTAGGPATDVTVKMGVLVGDVNSSKRVDSGDVTVVRQENLQTVEEDNFRADVNASGRIDSGDVTVVRQHNLTALP